MITNGITKNTTSLMLLMLFLFSPSQAVFAQDEVVRYPLGAEDWMYKMGGADSFLFYRQPNRTTLDFSAGADWQLFRGCQFDPKATVENSFENIKDSLYGLLGNLEDSAKNLVVSYGLFKLQESWPAAYNFLMDNGENAMAQFSIGLKTCRDFNSDLNRGRNPASGWIAYGEDAYWSGQSGSDNDVAEVADAAKTEGGNRGVTWIDGALAGGKNQRPIRAIGDVAKKGYQHLTANQNDAGTLLKSKEKTSVNSTQLAAEGTPISAANLNPDVDNESMVFTNVESAQSWLREVVGEREIRTCVDCEKLKSTAGQGLRMQIVKETDVAINQFTSAIKKAKPSAKDINALGVPQMGFGISDSMLRTIKSLEPREQSLMVNKLASEIAMMRAMTKALTARDILNAGMQDPNVITNENAMTEVEWSKKKLDEEMNNLLFEAEIRKKIFSPTALVLNELSRSRAGISVRDSQSPQVESPTIKNGSIYAPGDLE